MASEAGIQRRSGMDMRDFYMTHTFLTDKSFFWTYLFFIFVDWGDGWDGMELDEHMWCWDGYRMEEMKAWKIAMCEQMNDGMG